GGPEWLFDIDAILKSMNYAPVSVGSQSDNQERPNAGSITKTINTAGPIKTATPTYAEYPNDPLMPNLEDAGIFDDAYDDKDEGAEDDYNNLEIVEENLHITFLENKPMITGGGPEWLFDIDAILKSMNYAPVSVGSQSDNQERPNAGSITKTINTAGPIKTATPTYAEYPNDPLMPNLEDAGIFDDAYDDKDEGAEDDYNNLEIVISVSSIPSTRIHKNHPKEHIIG
nr:hypothetical protein [Tanacetum cinerariifolium]